MQVAARAITSHLTSDLLWRLEQWLALVCLVLIIITIPGETILAPQRAKRAANVPTPGEATAKKGDFSRPGMRKLLAIGSTDSIFPPRSDVSSKPLLLPTFHLGGAAAGAVVTGVKSEVTTGPRPEGVTYNGSSPSPPETGAVDKVDKEEAKPVKARPSQDKPLQSVPQASQRVALTFDDGPFPVWSEKYIQVLTREKVSATFFLVGRQAEEHPELTSALAAAGHEIGSHSWRHARLGKTKKGEALSDLQETNRALERVTGRPVRFFRPPYGDCNPELLQLANELGLEVVTWSIDPRDWTNPKPEHLVRHILDQVECGSIIVLHEGRPNTLAALPEIIAGLREKGFELVTVSKLLTSKANEENLAK